MSEQRAEKTPAFALVPLRDRKPIFRCRCSGKNDATLMCRCWRSVGQATRIQSQRQQPFVPIFASSAAVLGRMDFLHAMWDACLRSKGRNQFDGSTQCDCCECQKVNRWAGPCLPRRIVRVQVSSCSASSNHDTVVVQLPTQTSKLPAEQYVSIISQRETEGVKQQTTATIEALKDDDGWKRLGTMHEDDILQLPYIIADEDSDNAAVDRVVASLELRLCRIPAPAVVENTQTASSTTLKSSAPVSRKRRSAAGNSAILSPRSRYAVALQVSGGTTGGGDNDEMDEDDDDDSGDDDMSLASQMLESQEVYKPPAIALGTITSEIAIVEQSQILEKERLSITSAPSSPPDLGSQSPPLTPQSPNVKSDSVVTACEPRPRLSHGGETVACKLHQRQEIQTNEAESETQIAAKLVRHAPTLSRNDVEGDSNAAQTNPREAGGAHETTKSPSSTELPPPPPPPRRSSTQLTAATVVPSKRATAIDGPSLFVAPKETPLDGTKEALEAKQFVVHFVRKGIDMAGTHIDGESGRLGLREKVKQRGGIVLDSFDKTQPPWPTHFVISTKIEPSAVAASLGFDDENELKTFLNEHGIVCATRDWIAKGSLRLKEPEMKKFEVSLGFMTKKKTVVGKRSADNDFSPRSVKQKVDNTPHAPLVVRNEKLSEVFRQLSKRYRECPLDEIDSWRSYTFNLIAGRLRYLDFDVINDLDVLKQLEGIPHFGSSSMEIVKEYLEKGTVSRLQKFEIDKNRLAMRAMMNIWGVGRVKALKLVNSGYQTIGQVRHSLKTGALKLDRNQLIGVECYEEIMEEMSRAEVEAIFAVVSDAVKDRFPSAELMVMGSYRRGKETCGDVDILITHPDFSKEVPPKYLGVVLDDLRSNGHIAHHLTFIAGMKHEHFESLPESEITKLTSPSQYGRSRNKKDKLNTSSWMGIFNSPMVAGKRRRVDIKWYPHSERVFASLYFTGNGHFNRSMRLFATKKFNYQLSDHGLVDRLTKRPVMRDPETEKDVFDKLGLIWKEPHERDCFDAVESKEAGESVARMLNEMPEKDLRADLGCESRGAWIN